MTIREAIEIADNNRPNAFDERMKLLWLGELDGQIAAEIMLMSAEDQQEFRYTIETPLSTELLVKFPYDSIYVKYLFCKIDELNGEISNYNNSAAIFNDAYSSYSKWFLHTYEPVQDEGSYTPSYYITAYSLAVMQGFGGSMDEWLDSLRGHLHIKWAAQEPTSDADMKDMPDKWMGTLADNEVTASAHYTDYAWTRVRGEQLYIKYAAVSPTRDEDMTDVPERWMGVAMGTDAAPAHYTAYTWYDRGADSAVQSVNGERGEVQLSAEDVGAAAEEHGHSISEVTGLDDALAGKLPVISELTTGSTISDGDWFPFYHSGNVRSTWSNIKAKLKNYFDGMYAGLSHASRHAYGGEDALTVTQDMLASNAVSTVYTATIPTTGWDDNSITLTVSGLLSTDTPLVDVDMSDVDAEDAEDVQDAFALVYRMVAGTNALTVYATDVPETAIPIRLLCVRR